MARDGIVPAEIFPDRGRALPTNRLLWLGASVRAFRGAAQTAATFAPTIHGQATRKVVSRRNRSMSETA
jgi:hypothetical protein